MFVVFVSFNNSVSRCTLTFYTHTQEPMKTVQLCSIFTIPIIFYKPQAAFFYLLADNLDTMCSRFLSGIVKFPERLPTKRQIHKRNKPLTLDTIRTEQVSILSCFINRDITMWAELN